MTKQLALVAKFEREKEERFLHAYQKANQTLQQNLKKLEGLQLYKAEYLTMLRQKGDKGVGAMSYGQHQTFIDKLDKAVEQQSNILKQHTLATEQRKRQWLIQQKKRKAVEMLIDKKHQEALIIEAKQEQALMDEVALQRFVRAGRKAFS